jgi:hypothetical protein
MSAVCLDAADPLRTDVAYIPKRSPHPADDGVELDAEAAPVTPPRNNPEQPMQYRED